MERAFLLSKRKEIFRALLKLQDKLEQATTLNIRETKRIICERFKIGLERLEMIVGEGLDRGWVEETDGKPHWGKEEQDGADEAKTGTHNGGDATGNSEGVQETLE